MNRRTVRSGITMVAGASLLILLGAEPAFADNCGDLSDCSPSVWAGMRLLAALLGLATVFAVVSGDTHGSGGSGGGSAGAGGGAGGGADNSGSRKGPPAAPDKAPPAYDPNYIPPKVDLTPEQQQRLEEAQKKIKDAQDSGGGPEDWVNDINPTNSRDNCVEAAKAVDNTLGKHPTAAGPVQRGQDGYEIENAYPGRSLHGSTPGGISQDMLASGEGSRGIVVVTNGGHSHAFNVYNDGGTIKWIDGQSGKVSTSPGGVFDSSTFKSDATQYYVMKTFP